jgi:hypothetical protein
MSIYVFENEDYPHFSPVISAQPYQSELIIRRSCLRAACVQLPVRGYHPPTIFSLDLVYWLLEMVLGLPQHSYVTSLLALEL